MPIRKDIVIFKDVNPKNPVFIAAWPGMGHVALKSAEYLKNKLGAQLFARMPGQRFFHPTDINITNSIIQNINLPEGRFYFWQDPNGKNDLIIFIGDQQPPAEKNMAYAAAILDFMMPFEAKMILTFAAVLSSIDHWHSPKVWIAATNQKMLDDFQALDAQRMPTGQISGLNGLFLALAERKKFKGACLLGEIPFYAGTIENPKASLAVLHSLMRFLEIRIDLVELSLAAKHMEGEMEKLMTQLQHPMTDDEETAPITPEEIEKMRHLLFSHSQIPNSAKRQIEDLFSMAQKDLSTAFELKEKLDEWNAYKDYEDRFLELFKNREQRDN